MIKRTIMEISPAHLERDTYSRLLVASEATHGFDPTEPFDQLTVERLSCGVMVYTGIVEADPDAVLALPRALRDLLVDAFNDGVHWVLLDEDAIETEDYPVYWREAA